MFYEKKTHTLLFVLFIFLLSSCSYVALLTVLGSGVTRKLCEKRLKLS